LNTSFASNDFNEGATIFMIINMPCLMITVIYRVGALISVGTASTAKVGLASLDHFQLNAFGSDGTNLTAQEM
jgi:hypothetical protein